MIKQLSEYTLDELWRLFPIELKEHNSNYKNQYETACHELTSLLNKNIVRVNHIGSTAVKGLVAKPIVDILLEITFDTDIELLISLLCKNGWILMSKEIDPLLKLSFNKGYTPKGFDTEVFHLHIRYSGDWDELYFRDYLIENTAIAKDYEDLKRNLSEKYQYNRDAYTKSKTNFITKYTKLAREKYTNRYFN